MPSEAPARYQLKYSQAERSPACTHLFAVAELAEAVFLQVPALHDIANIQPVCRQWKAVMDASTPIQHTLFFEPIGTEPLPHRLMTGLYYRYFWSAASRPQEPALAVEYPLFNLKTYEPGSWLQK